MLVSTEVIRATLHRCLSSMRSNPLCLLQPELTRSGWNQLPDLILFSCLYRPILSQHHMWCAIPALPAMIVKAVKGQPHLQASSLSCCFGCCPPCLTESVKPLLARAQCLESLTLQAISSF